MPFFSLKRFTLVQWTDLSDVAQRLGVTPMQTALAWLMQRAPNILLIPGMASLGHLRENLTAARLKLSSEAVTMLDQIATVKAAVSTAKRRRKPATARRRCQGAGVIACRGALPGTACC